MLDFLCIGAQKAGTSWLYRHLNNAPGITFPMGKEIHYWDWVERKKRPDDPDWYIKALSKTNGLLGGDMTPCYALLTPDSINKIQTMHPNVKILYIIRNPIDRAWSAFKMGMSIMRMEPHEVSYQGMMDVLKSASSIQRSDHYTVIKNWTSVFGSEQILVMDFDDLVTNNRKFLIEVFSYLNLDRSYIDTQSDASLAIRINKGINMPMPENIRTELLTLYEQKIIELQNYLKKDLSHWL